MLLLLTSQSVVQGFGVLVILYDGLPGCERAVQVPASGS